MTRLLSWIGVSDFDAWKDKRARGDGALLAIAKHVHATSIELLWEESGSKIPIGESTAYSEWLEEQLREVGLESKVKVRPCADGNGQIMNFAWVYSQLEQLESDTPLKDEFVSVNASSGTPMMTACWIIFKKSTGLNLKLFISSREQGVEPLELPPNMKISIHEVFQAHRSGLFDHVARGEITLQAADISGLVGSSTRAKETFIKANAVASFTDVPILLLGPPGVGKTRLAEEIHRLSKLRGEFVPVDCGMLGSESSIQELWGWKKGAFTGADSSKEGRIVGAQNGTLFLDEVGNADARTQQNLLRLLQNKVYRPLGANEENKIDIRIIAATNRNLREDVAKGMFRQDLFDRLSVYMIDIPPLKDRPEDIETKAVECLREFNREWCDEIEKNLGGVCKVFNKEAITELCHYHWPGNFRELESVVTRLVVHTISKDEEITAQDVQEELAKGSRSLIDNVDALPPIGEGIDLNKHLNWIRFYYLKNAWAKWEGKQESIAKGLGLGSRTALRTIINNCRDSGYPVDDLKK